MALPSQQQRGGGMGPRLTGGRSRRRRRGRARRALALLSVVAGVGLLVWQWPSISGSSEGGTEPVANADGEAPSGDAARSGPSQLVVDRPRTSTVTPEREVRTPPVDEEPSRAELTMGNAVDQAKAAADRITLANTQDGVAHAIDKLLDGSW